MECHNYSFQLFSFSTWEVFLHLMATFKRWFVMTAWVGVAFFKGTSLCQVKWLGLLKILAMLCKLMWEVGRCIQSCSHSAGFNWFAMVACFIVNIQDNAWCSTFLLDWCRQNSMTSWCVYDLSSKAYCPPWKINWRAVDEEPFVLLPP